MVQILSAASRFSYLKELISPKVRVIVDGFFPFTNEGYARTKHVLIINYGKPSEVANDHIQNIMSLPHINSVNLYKIDELTEKFRSSHKRCSIKKVFLKISQNPQENTCARVSFLKKLQAAPATLLKNTLAQVFSCEFCEFFKNTFLQNTPGRLLGSVQALETMGKLKVINGYVRLALDKLQGIREDLVRINDGWQGWKFPQLVEALGS